MILKRDCVKLQKLAVLKRFTNALLYVDVLIFAFVSLRIS